jgi:uncharacterized membrane protein YbaN (DUF454 family)
MFVDMRALWCVQAFNIFLPLLPPPPFLLLLLLLLSQSQLRSALQDSLAAKDEEITALSLQV